MTRTVPIDTITRSNSPRSASFLLIKSSIFFLFESKSMLMAWINVSVRGSMINNLVICSPCFHIIQICIHSNCGQIDIRTVTRLNHNPFLILMTLAVFPDRMWSFADHLIKKTIRLNIPWTPCHIPAGPCAIFIFVNT